MEMVLRLLKCCCDGLSLQSNLQMGPMRRSSFCVVLVINVMRLVVGAVERDCDHYLMMSVH